MIKFKNKCKPFLFAFTVCVSSFSLQASQGVLLPAPDFSALRDQDPRNFKGFNDILEKLPALRYRKKEAFFEPITGLKDFFIEMKPLLEQKGGKFSEALGYVNSSIENSGGPSSADVIVGFLMAFLPQAKGNQEELDFFKAAGFSSPYNLVEKIDQNMSKSDYLALIEKSKYSQDSDPGRFSRSTNALFFGAEKMGKITKQSRFKKHMFILPGEGELGFFYLAWTYAQGLHPLPANLDEDTCSLHGIEMSRWGQMCHDSAHSEGDASDYSMEQFGCNLVSRYAAIIGRHSKEMTSMDERKKWGVNSMIEPFGAFAVTVHDLYRQSLVDILRVSLDKLRVGTDDFNAFSVAAFFMMHEEPVDMSRMYGEENLLKLLENHVRNQSPERAGSRPSETDTGEEKTNRDSLFSTSFRTGESSLTDEEIFQVVMQQKKSSFLNDYQMRYYLNEDSPFEEREISGFEVTRNKFSIDVTVDLLTGGFKVFRQGTNYARQLNFEHDLIILGAAKAVLKEEYEYTLPTIPSYGDFSEDASYETAVLDCLMSLEKGKSHLKEIFLKKACALAEMDVEDGTGKTISQRFSEGYGRALEELSGQVPEFVSRDTQGFINKARALDFTQEQ